MTAFEKLFSILLPLLFISFLFTSCTQLQINIGSNVNNIQPIKTQILGKDSKAGMTGSNLEDVARDLNQEAEGEVKLK